MQMLSSALLDKQFKPSIPIIMYQIHSADK